MTEVGCAIKMSTPFGIMVPDLINKHLKPQQKSFEMIESRSRVSPNRSHNISTQTAGFKAVKKPT